MKDVKKENKKLCIACAKVKEMSSFIIYQEALKQHYGCICRDCLIKRIKEKKAYNKLKNSNKKNVKQIDDDGSSGGGKGNKVQLKAILENIKKQNSLNKQNEKFAKAEAEFEIKQENLIENANQNTEKHAKKIKNKTSKKSIVILADKKDNKQQKVKQKHNKNQVKKQKSHKQTSKQTKQNNTFFKTDSTDKAVQQKKTGTQKDSNKINKIDKKTEKNQKIAKGLNKYLSKDMNSKSSVSKSANNNNNIKRSAERINSLFEKQTEMTQKSKNQDSVKEIEEASCNILDKKVAKHVNPHYLKSKS